MLRSVASEPEASGLLRTDPAGLAVWRLSSPAIIGFLPIIYKSKILIAKCKIREGLQLMRESDQYRFATSPQFRFYIKTFSFFVLKRHFTHRPAHSQTLVAVIILGDGRKEFREAKGCSDVIELEVFLLSFSITFPHFTFYMCCLSALSPANRLVCRGFCFGSKRR
jgi:hypothetical protein